MVFPRGGGGGRGGGKGTGGGTKSNGSSTTMPGETADEARYSIAFFCHPVGTTTLDVVPSEQVKNHRGAEKGEEGINGRGENPDVEKKAITADEHLQMRLQASYLKLYEKDNS